MRKKEYLKSRSVIVQGIHSPKRFWFACGLSLGLVSLPLSTFANNWSNQLGSSIQKSIQQNRIITGSVIDESGEALIGVSVLVKGTTLGTVTDLDGNFTLEVPTGAILVVSYVGYKTQEIKVGEQQKLAITVEADNKLLDEVVVVGYGVVKKSDLTGSVGSVKSETISAKGATSVVESLQGQVAGVNISQSSSRAGDGFNIQIRGKSSLNGGNPLYVIDGVVCENMDFLNPMDIEKVDILKDASSTAIYGSRATNGVVMITTKKGDKDGVKTKANMPDFMEGDDFMKFRFSRYLVSSMDASSGMTNWEMTDANFLNFWGNGSQIVKDMYLNNNYGIYLMRYTCEDPSAYFSCIPYSTGTTETPYIYAQINLALYYEKVNPAMALYIMRDIQKLVEKTPVPRTKQFYNINLAMIEYSNGIFPQRLIEEIKNKPLRGNMLYAEQICTTYAFMNENNMRLTDEYRDILCLPGYLFYRYFDVKKLLFDL